MFAGVLIPYWTVLQNPGDLSILLEISMLYSNKRDLFACGSPSIDTLLDCGTGDLFILLRGHHFGENLCFSGGFSTKIR